MHKNSIEIGASGGNGSGLGWQSGGGGGGGAQVLPATPETPLHLGSIVFGPAHAAPDLLAKAKQHMEARAAQYDAPGGERSMGRAVTAFNAITGRTLTEREGWLLLQVLKDVRLFQREAYHADSAEDCIAYAALKAEAAAKQ